MKNSLNNGPNIYSKKKLKKNVNWKTEIYNKKKKKTNMRKEQKGVFYKSWYYIMKFKFVKKP